MNTTLKQIKLGAPKSIVGGPSPNAELSIQSGANLTNVELRDIDSVKCTKDGSILSFLAICKAIEKANSYIDFEDNAVKTVLSKNAIGDSFGITTTDLAELTDIKTWFRNNTSIKFFKELSKSGIKTLKENAFNGCTSLQFVDLSQVEYLQNYVFTNDNINDGVIFAPRVKSIYEPFASQIAVFLPSLEQNQGATLCGTKQYELYDISPKMHTISNGIQRNGGKCKRLILRYNGVVTVPAIGKYGSPGCDAYYVPEDQVENYKSTAPWSQDASKIYAIGGEEWQADMRNLAMTYAEEHAEWTYDKISSTNYARAYIDYDIFGVDKTNPYVLFDDPLAEQIFMDAEWSSDGVGITLDDIKRHSEYSITLTDTAAGSIFNNKINNVRFFDELKYFENTQELGFTAMKSWVMESIEFPKNVITIRENQSAGNIPLKHCVLSDKLLYLRNQFFANSCFDGFRIDNVFRLGVSLFAGNTFLKYLIIGDNVHIVEQQQAEGTNCEYLEIGKGVTEISGQFFRNESKSLRTVIFKSEIPPVWNEPNWHLAPENLKIYVPDESLYLYVTANGFKDKSNIILPLSQAPSFNFN